MGRLSLRRRGPFISRALRQTLYDRKAMRTVLLVAVLSSLAIHYPMHSTYLERLVSLQLVE